MTAAVVANPASQPYVCAFLAALAVTCPRCKARPGFSCQSTGGGNPAEVVTHRARENRVEGFTEAQTEAAQALIKRARSAYYRGLRVDMSAEFAVFESAAAALPGKPSQPTPRDVRLTENQAEEIERIAHCGGVVAVSTAHFHGDHPHRQTINALEVKGILAKGDLVNHGYDRVYTMTDFGWRVYRQHPRIIRRLSDEQIEALIAAQAEPAVAA